MQPLDLDKIDAMIITAVKNCDTEAIGNVLREIIDRIQQAINPIGDISAPLVILALKTSAKAINDQIPGSNEMADTFGKLFGFVSIKVPNAPQIPTPPEP